VTADDLASIRRMLESHNTLTLATCADGRPWAASLFFASDAKLNLYFVSDYRTRHARDLAAGSAAVATVNTDAGRWTEVKGLQIQGEVSVVEGIRRAAAMKAYLAKFADVRALFEMPKNQDEETIAERLRAATFYAFRPSWIRLIDNSRWFGYKLELEL
jgi:uncharacterized protein YhbP (UPF0306 family)